MKPANKEALRERARRALQNLYHNATPAYSRELYGRSEDTAQAWFQNVAEQEIEYLRDGGSYGKNYRRVLAADCNAGKYKSEKARAYYVAKGMRAMHEERADCGAISGWRVLELAAGSKRAARILRKYPGAKRNNAQWERISEYGKLYQWGRGGRTLAPNDLIKQCGGSSFAIREDYADDMSAERLVDFIRVLKSFNAFVESWCAGVPEMWREHCESEDAEALREKRVAAAAKGKETKERRYWAARDVLTTGAQS